MLKGNEVEPGILIEKSSTYGLYSRLGRFAVGIVGVTGATGIIGVEFYKHMDAAARISGLVIAGICLVTGIGNIRDGIRGSDAHKISVTE